jgi:hypothetical protein
MIFIEIHTIFGSDRILVVYRGYFMAIVKKIIDKDQRLLNEAIYE